MILHVLTAVTRPHNLPVLQASIAAAATDDVHVIWHQRSDPDRTAVGGQRLKNEMLDEIDNGWVYVLDDDTIMHPDLLRTIFLYRKADAILVAQERVDRVLHPAPANLQVGEVDIGQAVLRRDLIGLERIPEVYEGDGIFLRGLLAEAPGVVFVDRVLSTHNALERVAA